MSSKLIVKLDVLAKIIVVNASPMPFYNEHKGQYRFIRITQLALRAYGFQIKVEIFNKGTLNGGINTLPKINVHLVNSE